MAGALRDRVRSFAVRTVDADEAVEIQAVATNDRDREIVRGVGVLVPDRAAVREVHDRQKHGVRRDADAPTAHWPARRPTSALQRTNTRAMASAYRSHHVSLVASTRASAPSRFTRA